jgi:hypothetical protein
VLPDPMRGFGTYPLLASAAVDVFRATNDTPVLSQAAYSIARYYRFLMTSADRDGDRLVETAAPWARNAPMEDPAFNSLLALDMRNLARMNLEVRGAARGVALVRHRAHARAGHRACSRRPGELLLPHDPTSGRPVRSLNDLPRCRRRSRRARRERRRP